MQNLTIARYQPPTEEERAATPAGCLFVADCWAGWIEPVDHTWILFVDVDGRPHLYPNRDPETGAVTDDDGQPIVMPVLRP